MRVRFICDKVFIVNVCVPEKEEEKSVWPREMCDKREGGGGRKRERERFGFDRDLNRIHLCANFCSLMTNRIKRRERES